MTDRLPTHLLVTALLRRVNDAGGIGMVRARGDAAAGTLLFLCAEQGGVPSVYEEGRDLDGRRELRGAGPAEADAAEIEEYWRRRRARDPDLWVIELDIPFAERFAAETIASN